MLRPSRARSLRAFWKALGLGDVDGAGADVGAEGKGEGKGECEGASAGGYIGGG